MGRAKQWEEQEERGFAYIDGSVCTTHIVDDVLLTNLDEQPPAVCVVCGSNDLPVVSLDAIGDEVKKAIDYFWEPGYYGHGYEFGGHQNDTGDVVQDVCAGAFADNVYYEITARIERAIDAISGNSGWLWNRQQELGWSWDLYSDNVRRTNRFVFPQAGIGSVGHPALDHTATFLDQMMTYVHGDLNLVQRVGPGANIFRGRLAEAETEFAHNATELGPPPSTKAAANRMSAAGISLFYGCEDPQTAIAEIAGHGPKPLAVVGEFKSTRALFILDLTCPPPHPGSVFDPDKRPAITMWQFLRTFVEKVTKPVIPDGREHVEYAPTQVLTEYIRYMSRTQVDGIALPSGPGGGKKTYVLFAGPSEVSDAPGQSGHWLILAGDAIAIYDVDRAYAGRLRRQVP